MEDTDKWEENVKVELENTLDCSLKKKDILLLGKSLFFPNGESKLEEFEFDIIHFCEMSINNNIMVEQFYVNTKVTILILYCH